MEEVVFGSDQVVGPIDDEYIYYLLNFYNTNNYTFTIYLEKRVKIEINLGK